MTFQLQKEQLVPDVYLIRSKTKEPNRDEDVWHIL